MKCKTELDIFKNYPIYITINVKYVESWIFEWFFEWNKLWMFSPWFEFRAFVMHRLNLAMWFRKHAKQARLLHCWQPILQNVFCLRLRQRLHRPFSKGIGQWPPTWPEVLGYWNRRSDLWQFNSEVKLSSSLVVQGHSLQNRRIYHTDIDTEPEKITRPFSWPVSDGIIPTHLVMKSTPPMFL